MPTFQLFDTTLAEATPNVFGVWETRVPEETVSFGAPGEEVDETPVWSVNLSADPALAQKQISASLAQVNASQQGLASAQKRIAGLVAHQRAEGEVSFGAPSLALPALPASEQELLQALGALQQHREDEVNYGLFDSMKQAVSRAVEKVTGEDDSEEKFKAVMERMTASLVYYAAVETKMENAVIARTQINWVSDTNTLWRADATPVQWELHQRTLMLAVNSRNALMKTFGLTAQAAIKLSVLLATPGGAILALPAAWKYINQILVETGQHRLLNPDKEK